MIIKILREAGKEEAMLGLSLSYNATLESMDKVMDKLCHKDGGHNKFLESIVVWLDMTAPRYFWQQFDTYRVGTTKQSESTMHTILSRELTNDDFEYALSDVTLAGLNRLIRSRSFEVLKNELPEGFLQRRIVCTNYKVLRSILTQREKHKSNAWGVFCQEILAQAEIPHFLKKG
jgi:hypothetical protein